MNKLFIDDLVERFEFELDTVLDGSQGGVKSKLIELGECEHFPMVCYEHTNDSSFEVDMSESKFLNDSAHIGTWLMGINEDEIIFVLNLKNKGNSTLEIDALEVRDELRGQGLGANIVAVIESVAEQYYNEIIVSPFDTDAQVFWEKMDYEWRNDGSLIKKLND